MTVEEIKQQYSMREIVEKYGIKVNRVGFCSCPFHSGDREPSMKIYAKDYHCHACGANGDIFTFVEKMDNVDFKTAYLSLGGEYKAKSDYQHKLFQYRIQKRKETEEKKKQEEERERLQAIESIKINKLATVIYPVFSDEWCDSMNQLEILFYKLSQITEKR